MFFIFSFCFAARVLLRKSMYMLLSKHYTQLCCWKWNSRSLSAVKCDYKLTSYKNIKRVFNIQWSYYRHVLDYHSPLHTHIYFHRRCKGAFVTKIKAIQQCVIYHLYSSIFWTFKCICHLQLYTNISSIDFWKIYGIPCTYKPGRF